VGYGIADASEFEGRRKLLRATLGVSAFGINQFDSPPGFEGKEHDEVDTGQEEVYIPLAGAGFIRIGDETVELAPGRYVFVSPELRRQVVAGPEGLSYAVVGAPPGAHARRSS
jgi:uncharacterized cupin superfamily protein